VRCCFEENLKNEDLAVAAYLCDKEAFFVLQIGTSHTIYSNKFRDISL